MGIFDSAKAKTNVYAKKASLSYEDCVWLYEHGIQAGQSSTPGDKQKIEDAVNIRLFKLFPERREKNINWNAAEAAMKDHIPLEIRNKILGKMFSE
jgi:hypothetical protein